MGIQNTLKALSDPVRREILNMLKSGQMAAGEITEKFDITGAAISRHLSVLKEADLVRVHTASCVPLRFPAFWKPRRRICKPVRKRIIE